MGRSQGFLPPQLRLLLMQGMGLRPHCCSKLGLRRRCPTHPQLAWGAEWCLQQCACCVLVAACCSPPE